MKQSNGFLDGNMRCSSSIKICNIFANIYMCNCYVDVLVFAWYTEHFFSAIIVDGIESCNDMLVFERKFRKIKPE
jgi:hypothetical protein